MMEQRRALTIPFSVNKDNLMENPLRIPVTCLSAECGKLDRQVPWTAIAGCKLRHSSQHRNGSTMLDCSHAAMISSEMTRRQPLLLLTDVLKTEPGKAYMERMRKGLLSRSSRERRGSVPSSSDRKSQVTEPRSNGRKSSTPRGRQKTPPQSSRRSNLRRRQQTASDEADEDTENVKNEEAREDGDKFSEVVDCGLSLRWEPSEEAASRDEFPPADIKDKGTEPERDAQLSSRRKRKDSGLQCNGTSSPKRHRGSVLRLTGDEGQDGEEAPAAVSPQETLEDAEPEGQDVLQFTVGGDDQAQVLLPVSSPSATAAADVVKSPRRGSAPSTAEAKPSEPIVLSSDDEESENISRRCSQAASRRPAVGNTVIRGLSSQKARRTGVSNFQNIEVLQVIVQDIPRLAPPPPIPDDDYSRIEVAFSALHCGGFHGKSNGDIMIEKQRIIIPLQDASEQMEVVLSFSSKELRRYSVWEQHELEEEEICFLDDEDPYPPAVLLFFLSDKAAAAVQRDLCRLGIKRRRASKAAKASPFVVLTLSCPLEGVKGALLRSVLDIECLNTMAQEQVALSPAADVFPGLDDYLSPVLSLEESIELITKTGLDPHLLSMLCLKDPEPVLNVDRGSSQSAWHKSPAAPTERKFKSAKGSQVVEVDISHVLERGTPPALERKTSPPQKPESSSVLERKTSEPHKPESPSVLKRRTSEPQKPESSAVLKTKTSPLQNPENSSIPERKTSEHRKPETSSVLKPNTSPPKKQESSSVLELKTCEPQKTESSSVLKPKTSPLRKPESSLVLEEKTCKLKTPESSSVLKSKTSQLQKPESSSVLEQKTSQPQKLESSSELKSKTSPPQKPENSSVLEPKTSPPQKLESTSALEQRTSPPQELESSSVPKPKASPPQKPETSSVLEPETSLVLEPETSPALKPDTYLSPEPKTSPPQELEAPLALEVSPALKPEASPSVESETSPSSQPEASPAPEPETPPSIESETSPSVEPERSPAVEPEEGTMLKPKDDLENDGAEDPACQDAAPVYTLCHRRNKGSYSVSMCKPNAKWTKYKHQGLARRLIQFPPPPQKGGITVTMEDLQCLDNGQFLNDVIIDFYLKYLLQNAPASVAERTHIFSSFFYKQLTRRDNASEGGSSESCQRQRRHQRVKTWTRHVDIFQKDFLFVPVNQEAHWYLVVICFPGLDEPRFEERAGPESRDEAEESPGQEGAAGRTSSGDAADSPPPLSCSSTASTQPEKAQEHATKDFILSPVNCTELTCEVKTVCKRPSILIMDSLKLSLHERVVKLLRDYLQSEWEVRRGSSREFGPDQMKSSHCKVPLQDNSSDCGLYLLQYVESFLKDPVVHFELPLCLERWFPRQQVRRKRDAIRDLILYLYRLQNLDLRHVELPSF
ncbi:microtubule-associated protein futsch isoform X2 [Salarias fasciatus]|uniref:microtubule-associated protein futsch isoform X2 n=1 Tax=Salarias fasciatus TaxID=181472 RepID=UPI0011764D55|nr:sentrin-specific protease 7 isoform X2 [Salarias fasciatus]